MNFILPNGLDKIGGKGIGVYGGLDIHGKKRLVPWTKLGTTVQPGTNVISLTEPVDWVVGEKVIITTTSYILEHTEIMTIAEVNGNKMELTFTESLVFEHLSYEENFDDGIYFYLFIRENLSILKV